MNLNNVVIRQATAQDMPAVMELIKQLAEYEKAADQVNISYEDLVSDGYGAQPLFYCYVACQQDQVLGFALYYFKYSTWKGKSLYLEDLLIDEPYRRSGLGMRLLKTLIAEAKEKACGRMEWQVLDWNHPAIEAYKKLDPIFEDDWLNVKLLPSDFERILDAGI